MVEQQAPFLERPSGPLVILQLPAESVSATELVEAFKSEVVKPLHQEFWPNAKSKRGIDPRTFLKGLRALAFERLVTHYPDIRAIRNLNFDETEFGEQLAYEVRDAAERLRLRKWFEKRKSELLGPLSE